MSFIENTTSGFTKGLETYQLIQTGFIVFIIVLCLIGSIFLLIYNMRLKYTTTSGQIILNPDLINQTLIYTVNKVEYRKTLQSVLDKNNRRIFTQTVGSCTVYYPSEKPNEFSINVNPTFTSKVIAGILFIISILASLWFYFLYTHPEYTAVLGGINAARSIY